jgi:hypothetical protein
MNSESHQKMPKGLVLFYTTQLISRLSVAIWIPITAVFVIALGGTVLTLGELSVIFGVVYSVSAYFISKLGHKHRYKLLPISYGLAIIYAIALCLINSPDQLYAAILFGGLSTSLRASSLKAVALDFIDKKQFIIYQQKQRMFGSFIAAIAGYIGARIIHHSGSPNPHLSHDYEAFLLIFYTMIALKLGVFALSLIFYKRYKSNVLAKTSSQVAEH